MKSITVTSKAFTDSGFIPAKYTCDSLNVSPPIEWTKGPENTKTYVLICDDPDAPSKVWVHWILYNIPSTTLELPEGLPIGKTILAGAKQGLNDSGVVGYFGPCPPSGVHRYMFKLYALDCEINLEAGASKKDVETAMKDHILAEGMITGKYARK